MTSFTKAALGIALTTCLAGLAIGAPSKQLRDEISNFREKAADGNARIKDACGCEMRFDIDVSSYEGHDANDAHAAGFIPGAFGDCAEQYCTDGKSKRQWCKNIQGARVSRGEGPMTYAGGWFTLRTKGTGYGFVDTTCVKGADGR